MADSSRKTYYLIIGFILLLTGTILIAASLAFPDQTISTPALIIGIICYILAFLLTDILEILKRKMRTPT